MSGSLTRKCNRHALSLLEVLVTVIILSFGLTLIVRSSMMNLRALRLTQDYTKASLLAEEKVWPYLQQGSIATGVDSAGAFAEPNENFRYRLRTSRAQGQNAMAPLNTVTLQISWQRDKKTRTTVFTTLLRAQDL